MDLTADAIRKIQELTDAADPIVEAPDFRTTGRFYTRTADGGLEEQMALRPAVAASVYSTASLATLLERELSNGAHVRVFYGPDRITAICVDDTEQWRHCIDLNGHPAFHRLGQIARTESFGQKALIRLLRAEFNGHVDDRIIERFRTLNLKTDGSGQSVVAQGRAAVDRRIQQAISDQGGKEIPTEITVTVPVYDLDEAREDLSSVRLLVDVAPDEDGRPLFELTAVINDLRAARLEALDRIMAALRTNLPDGIDLFYGSA